MSGFCNPPAMRDDQRRAALQVGNDIRRRNADTTRAIKALPRPLAVDAVADLIEACEHPASRIPISRILVCIPLLGEQKIRYLLKLADVWSGDRRLGELAPRQRAVLADAIRNYKWMTPDGAAKMVRETRFSSESAENQAVSSGSRPDPAHTS